MRTRQRSTAECRSEPRDRPAGESAVTRNLSATGGFALIPKLARGIQIRTLRIWSPGAPTYLNTYSARSAHPSQEYYLIIHTMAFRVAYRPDRGEAIL